MLITSCNGQETNGISEKDLLKLFEQEKRNEERAKYGGKSSAIEVISDPQEVEKLKTYIANKNSEKKAEELEKLQNKTITERYKAGDKSVVPTMIEVLKGDDQKAKKEIYINLDRNYDEPDDYQISEPELISAILDNISIPEDEKLVIQLAGIMNLPGYPDVFEKHLLSGNAKDIDRLVYWLGRDAKSAKTLDFIENLVLSNNFDFEKYPYVMSGLEEFSESTDSLIKRKSFEISLEIYHRKLIPKESFEEIESVWSSSNPAINLTEILFKSEDQRVIPIANEFLKKGLCEQKALIALIGLEGEKHESSVYKLLKDEDTFFDGLWPAEKLYAITQDKKIVETILIQFEKREKHTGYLIDRIVSSLISMGATEYFSDLENILKNTSLISSLSSAYELTKGSAEAVANDLYKLGVVDTPFPPEVIAKAKQKTENYGSTSYIYEFLNVSGIYQWFDAETGFVPVDYDHLIMDFSKNSNHKLSNITVWMDAVEDKNYNFEYKIYVSANEKIYVMTPEDIGDWYDVEMTMKLMNTILEDSKMVERFIFIDTGDQTVQIIFGPKNNVDQFIKKYKLKG